MLFASASYVAFYSETFKMADALQASCAAPVFKRPRLEFSSCESEALISYESVSSEERFSIDSGLQDDSNEVTSSSDCHDDHPGGDPQSNRDFSSPDTSGVHAALDSIESHPIFEQSAHNGFISENPSSMLAHEAFSRSHPQPGDPEENDVEDQESTVSELSGLSDLSNISGQDWKPTGPIAWVQRQMLSGIDPRLILGELLPKGTFIPHNVNDSLLWRLIVNLVSEPKRSKLSHINTLDDAVNLLRISKKIVILTGAGVSVSCGIPDFRSRNGIYARLSKDYPDLPDPQAMFDIHYFRRDPRPFFKFAKEIYPGLFQPSPSHRFIKLLEKQGKLLRNYTQNIDTLEHAAGIQNVITCHGSFATATCTVCGYRVDSSVIKDDIFSQRIPYCPICPAEAGYRGIMKPDIVFFGEGLSDEFHEALANDKDVCDLLIVMGSSLKVRPVAMIPSSIPTNVPQILINREPLKHLTFDIELLGDCDVIIGEICRRLEMDWVIDEDIPRSQLKEIPVSLSSKRSAVVANESVPVDSAEVNNNFESSSSQAETYDPSNIPPSEESNSCDCRGLSAIKLSDSEDGSNQEQPPVETSSSKKNESDFEDVYDSKHLWPTNSRESISKRLPDDSYLYFPPSRYIFTGAEVYRDGEDDDCCSTPTDYSSDCGSPQRPPLDDSTGDISNEILSSHFPPVQSVVEEAHTTDESTAKSEHQEESPKT